MKNLFLIAVLLLIGLKTTAQNKVEIIPFTLNKQSNICIKAKVNDSDTLTLMFHSASTDVTLLKEVIGKKVKLNLDKNGNVESWGGKTNSEYSEGHTLTIGNLKWDSLTVFTNENSGEGTDGKFGHDIFKGKVLEIDYDKKLLSVYQKLPKKVRKYAKMKFQIKRGSIYIEGALIAKNMVFKDTFLFHTGYGGSVLLDPKIAARYDLPTQLKTISSSELRDSYNNIIKIDTKELPEVIIDGIKLENIPLSIAAQSSNIPMKVFGNDLLKRFNIIFDFQKNEMYMRKNSLVETAFYVKK